MRVGLRGKVTLSTIGVGVLLVVLLYVWEHYQYKDALRQQQSGFCDSLSPVIATALISPMQHNDRPLLTKLAHSMVDVKGLNSIRIFNLNDELLAEANKTDALTALATAPAVVEREWLHHAEAISFNGRKLGYVELGYGQLIFNTHSEAIIFHELTLIAFALALLAFISFLWGSYIAKRLRKVALAAQNISESGPGFQLQDHGHDEISKVSQALNQMSTSLGESQQELRESLKTQQELAQLIETHRSILRATISSSLDAIITIDAEGHVVEFSESAERIFGFSRDEMIGQELAESIIPDQYRQAHRQGMKRFKTTGQAVVLGQRLELTALRKNGEEFPCELAISRVEEGSNILFTAFMRDISDRHGYEEELKLAAHAFEASEAIFIADKEANIVRVNQAFTHITGYEFEDVAGANPSVLASGQHDEVFYQQMWAELQSKGQWSGEIVNRRKNGELLPEFLTISSVLNREGEVSHYVAHFTDLSEQKAVEDSLRTAQEVAESASKAKSRFLATMSHEIRTPLNAIINMNLLLQETQLTTQQRQLLNTASEAGQTLVALLNNVLDFSRIEAGRIELNPEWFSAIDTARSIVEIFEATASQKHLLLTFDADSTIPAQFYGDSLRFRQILLNLMGNAMKFTLQGEVKLELKWQDDQLRLAIHDTGPGIAPELQKNLFDEFFQVDDSRTRHHSGTGLGLAITQQLVELMEGRITLQSTPGVGTTFTVVLPLPSREQAAPKLEPQASLAAPALLEQEPSILLVEDSASNRAVATEVLSNQVRQITVAENGQEAVELAQQLPFDLILMDMAMPVMDGLEATRAIRAMEGPNQTTAILAMTANAFAEDREACLNAGMDDFISKPLDIPLLRSKVSEWAGVASTKSQDQTGEPVDSHDTEKHVYLDKKIMQKLYSEAGDKAVVHIVNLYLEEAPARVAKLQQAVTEQDYAIAEMEAHTLKSSSGTLGLVQLQTLSKELEFAAKDEQQERLETLCPSLQEKLEISLLELELFVQQCESQT